MRILGIDPGSRLVGCGCLELMVEAASRSKPSGPLAHRVSNLVVTHPEQRTAPRIVNAQVLRLGASAVPIVARLAELQRRLEVLLDELHPEEIALEEAFGGRSVQSALRVGEARGVVLATAGRQGVAVFQYAPARVKRAITGNGQASKAQVAFMVGQALGLEDVPRPADLTDALAVALCRAHERRNGLLGCFSAAPHL